MQRLNVVALSIAGVVDIVLTCTFVALMRQSRTGFVGYVFISCSEPSFRPRCDPGPVYVALQN